METSNVVELSVGKVELIDKLTWGQQEAIRESMYSALKVRDIAKAETSGVEFDASAITASKYKTLEVCIKKITDLEGKEVGYSRDWVYALSIEDGDKLYSAVNEIASKKK